jgi:hypothetical protein
MDLEVSVVIPFADDEERVGALGARVAAHLRALGVRFEIIAVDEDCRDNSAALLDLLREVGAIPELRVMEADGPGEGFATGARTARGSSLWLLDVERAHAPLAAFSWAHARLRSGAVDVAFIKGRFLLVRRTRAWRALDAVRGRGDVFERRFVRRAVAHRLVVESPPAVAPPRFTRRMARVIQSLAPVRFLRRA